MKKKVSLANLRQFGLQTAREIKKTKKTKVFALVGDLGAGKTTFVQYLAEGLGIKRRVISPTFVITRHYSFYIKKQKFTLYHVDLYRLSEEEVGQIGLKDLINEPNSLVAIEWAEKAKELVPEEAIWLEFKHRDEETRTITVNG